MGIACSVIKKMMALLFDEQLLELSLLFENHENFLIHTKGLLTLMSGNFSYKKYNTYA